MPHPRTCSAQLPPQKPERIRIRWTAEKEEHEAWVAKGTRLAPGIEGGPSEPKARAQVDALRDAPGGGEGAVYQHRQLFFARRPLHDPREVIEVDGCDSGDKTSAVGRVQVEGRPGLWKVLNINIELGNIDPWGSRPSCAHSRFLVRRLEAVVNVDAGVKLNTRLRGSTSKPRDVVLRRVPRGVM